MKFSIYQGSRQGRRRTNQDRLAYSFSKNSIILVVADGMGGRKHGEIAAHLAVRGIIEAFEEKSLPKIKSPALFLTEAIKSAHQNIIDNALNFKLSECPCTTVVAAIVQHGIMYCAHAGDSRLYHIRNNKIIYRTEDHSVVQSLYNQGVITLADIPTHRYRHHIYNCLGGEHPIEITISNKIELQEGDTILLCSDGLWGAIPEQSLVEIMSNNPMSVAITKLLTEAEKSIATNGDNMSAICLQLGEHGLISTQNMPLDETTTMINPMSQVTYQDPYISNEEIESTIATIKAALAKSKKSNIVKK